jgi:hypothetical protein
MSWALWALVLVAQAASSTWASRARNTGSVAYHGVAASFSHGVWFVSNMILTVNVVAVAQKGGTREAVTLGIFYTFFCVCGSILAHWLSARFFEQGKRRIGA